MNPPETLGGGLETGPWGEKEGKSLKGQTRKGCAGDIGSYMVRTVRTDGVEVEIRRVRVAKGWRGKAWRA